MKNIILLLSLIVFFISCTPEGRQHRKEQKLARLIKDNPQLVDVDTIYKDTLVAVPALHETISLDLSHVEARDSKRDLVYIEKLKRKFFSSYEIDSSMLSQNNLLDTLIEGVRSVTRNSGNIDTTITSGNSKVRYKKTGTKVDIDILTTPPPVKFNAPVATTTIKVPPIELRWYEKIFKFINTTMGLLGFSLLILLLFYAIYKVTKWAYKNG